MNHSWCLPVVASETFYANLNPLNLNLRDLLSFQSHATSSKLLEHAGDIFSLLTNQVHIKLRLTQTAQLSIFPAVLHLFEGPTWEIEIDKRKLREKKLSERWDSDLWPLDHEAQALPLCYYCCSSDNSSLNDSPWIKSFSIPMAFPSSFAASCESIMRRISSHSEAPKRFWYVRKKYVDETSNVVNRGRKFRSSFKFKNVSCEMIP